MEYFFIQMLNSLQYGLLLFLVASGLTLIFGIMNIINMAHGSFYMLGAYMALSLSMLFDNFFVVLMVGSGLSLVFGMILEVIFFSYLYKREHLQQVLMTYGLILIFEEIRKILIGNDVHAVAVPEIFNFSLALNDELSYPAYRLFIGAICLVMVVILYFIINKTRLGMRIRAASVNGEMVQALGINYRLLQQSVFGLGVFLASFAGMIVAPQSSVYPGMGGEILIICFVVVVIGGIGSIKGALIGALLIGVMDSFGKIWWQSYSGFSVYLLMALVLLIKPNGLCKPGT